MFLQSIRLLVGIKAYQANDALLVWEDDQPH